jgi:outer membrane protein assembly factor BamA
MTLTTSGSYAFLGVNVNREMRLSFGESLRRFSVTEGGVRDLPFTGDVFPSLPGLDGATVHAQHIAFTYDSRDSERTPTRGILASAFAEVSSEAFGSASDYVKGGVSAVYLHPVGNGRVVLVTRGLFEALGGDDDTPFQVRPSLGGVDTLRGFGDNRFFDNARVVLSAEVRTRVLTLDLFGVRSAFELAPFIDVGRVFQSLDDLTRGDYEVTPGIGLRALAPPSVVGHLEIGVSREGPAIFVGLDYPF